MTIEQGRLSQLRDRLLNHINKGWCKLRYQDQCDCIDMRVEIDQLTEKLEPNWESQRDQEE
jgi:hypothetical protein